MQAKGDVNGRLHGLSENRTCLDWESGEWKVVLQSCYGITSTKRSHLM